MDGLQKAFNRGLFLGLQNFEGHYSSYPDGGFYQRHRDSLKKNNDRVVSLILYLNSDWKESDGGCLRVYGADDSYSDIDPVGGTLVCFMSQDLDHEVRLSHATRLSFTGWFRVARPIARD